MQAGAGVWVKAGDPQLVHWRVMLLPVCHPPHPTPPQPAHPPSITVRGSTTLPRLLLIFCIFSSSTKPCVSTVR
jgi:hypothetical protein